MGKARRARAAARASAPRTLPQPDLPNHPSRPHEELLCGRHYDMWCPVCGWPDTHHLPAAEVKGLL